MNELVVMGEEVQVGDVLVTYEHDVTFLEYVAAVGRDPWPCAVVMAHVVRLAVYKDGSIGRTDSPRYFGKRAPMLVKRADFKRAD